MRKGVDGGQGVMETVNGIVVFDTTLWATLVHCHPPSRLTPFMKLWFSRMTRRLSENADFWALPAKIQ